MSSTLHAILDELKDLVEGTSGDTRVVAAGKFSVAAEDELTAVAMATAEPRPTYIIDDGAAEDPGAPGDVSGNYLWRARKVVIFVAYGYPSAHPGPLDRPTAITDDEMDLVGALTWPINWSAVDGWAGCEISGSKTIIQRDTAGLAALKWLVLDLLITYREAVA